MQNAFSLVKSRLALRSPGCLFVCQKRLAHKKMVVDRILVIKAIDRTLFPNQTRPDKTRKKEPLAQPVFAYSTLGLVIVVFTSVLFLLKALC